MLLPRRSKVKGLPEAAYWILACPLIWVVAHCVENRLARPSCGRTAIEQGQGVLYSCKTGTFADLISQEDNHTVGTARTQGFTTSTAISSSSHVSWTARMFGCPSRDAAALRELLPANGQSEQPCDPSPSASQARNLHLRLSPTISFRAHARRASPASLRTASPAAVEWRYGRLVHLAKPPGQIAADRSGTPPFPVSPRMRRSSRETCVPMRVHLHPRFCLGRQCALLEKNNSGGRTFIPSREARIIDTADKFVEGEPECASTRRHGRQRRGGGRPAGWGRGRRGAAKIRGEGLSRERVRDEPDQAADAASLSAARARV
eukprot:362139-Chlamydomonas_euryale.AAC.2